MATHRNPVPDAIRKIRAVTRENQTQFAIRIGVAVATLARYETGKQRPEVPVLEKLQVVAIENNLMKVSRVFANEANRLKQRKQKKGEERKEGLRSQVKALRTHLQTSMGQSQALLKRVDRARQRETLATDLEMKGLAERIKSLAETEAAIIEELQRWEKILQGLSTERACNTVEAEKLRKAD